MARRPLPRNVTPAMSGDPADKLYAAMKWPIGKFRGSSYEKAPRYFDACLAWHEALTDDQLEWLSNVIAAFTHWGEEAGKQHAARLPPAPRCPL